MDLRHDPFRFIYHFSSFLNNNKAKDLEWLKKWEKKKYSLISFIAFSILNLLQCNHITTDFEAYFTFYSYYSILNRKWFPIYFYYFLNTSTTTTSSITTTTSITTTN